MIGHHVLGIRDHIPALIITHEADTFVPLVVTRNFPIGYSLCSQLRGVDVSGKVGRRRLSSVSMQVPAVNAMILRSLQWAAHLTSAANTPKISPISVNHSLAFGVSGFIMSGI